MEENKYYLDREGLQVLLSNLSNILSLKFLEKLTIIKEADLNEIEDTALFILASENYPQDSDDENFSGICFKSEYRGDITITQVAVPSTKGNIFIRNIKHAGTESKEISNWFKFGSDKADINSPSFTGIPTAPTASAENNSTQIATTAFVKNALSEIIPASGDNALNVISDFLKNPSDPEDLEGNYELSPREVLSIIDLLRDIFRLIVIEIIESQVQSMTNEEIDEILNQ